MPPIKAHADLFRDWDGVLGACAQNADLLPGVDALTTELEGQLAQAKDLKIQQETLEGKRRAVTQQLEAAFEAGKETARKIRAFVVVHLGSADAAISQFGVAVRKRRGGKKAKAPETPPSTVSQAVTATTGTDTQPNSEKEAQHA